MRNLVAGLVTCGVFAFSTAGIAVAADPHSPSTTGQPNQSCQAQTSTPGNAANAPGSAFNTSGVAGSHYAGTQPQNSNNLHSVSQYDVACFQVSRP
jgi:hypothetical protein